MFTKKSKLKRMIRKFKETPIEIARIRLLINDCQFSVGKRYEKHLKDLQDEFGYSNIGNIVGVNCYGTETSLTRSIRKMQKLLLS